MHDQEDDLSPKSVMPGIDGTTGIAGPGPEQTIDTEANLIRRAFDLVTELNDVASRLSEDYTLEISTLEVSTFGDSHPMNSFQLRITKEVRRP